MKNFVERYWVTILGFLFLFGSFLALFELAIDRGWLQPAGRAAIGLVSGTTIAYVSYLLFRKKSKTISELVAGLSAGLFFITIAYASFSKDIMWSANILLISMMALCTLIMLIGYKLNMRILVIISVLAGLFTPLIIKATPEQVNVLFIYVLIINVLSLTLSVLKNWTELRLVSFLTTSAIFISYYFYFDPESWGRPFFYVSSLFVIYMVGLFATSKIENNQFSGVNLYLSILNAIHYVFWSIFILSNFSVSYALPSLIVSVSFLAGGFLVYRSNPKEVIPSLVYFILGLFVLAISGQDFSQLFSSAGMPFVINCGLWLVISLVIFAVGNKLKIPHVKFVGLGAWVFVLVYWYSVAWEVEWLPWFGVKYIPFLNAGAILWMALATSGFVLAKQAKSFTDLPVEHKESLSLALAVLSHIVVGGLLTIQIENLWDAYAITSFKSGIAISTSWFLYALGLFIWGKHERSKLFLWFGGLVLVLSSIKMWVFDLPGEDGIYKVLFLFISGGVILLIGFIHRKWIDIEEVELNNSNVLKSDQNDIA